MKHLRLSHGIYKNLPSGTVYNSQAGAIFFALGTAFKISALPGLIAKDYASSTLWAYVLLALVELLGTVCIFAFVRLDGDAFLRASASKAYKVICMIVAVWFSAKGTFYFCYSSSYLTHELFGGISPSLIYFLLIAPVVYLGVKGARSIARTCEIIIPVIVAMIVLNFVFLDTDLDAGRNLPFFAVEPSEFFAGLPKFGLWLGDALPFAFLKIKNKKLPYLSTSIGATSIVVLLAVFFGVAIYGESLMTVSDLLIRLAGFNQLSLEIGRMEWTHLFSVVALSIISLSFIFFGCTCATERAMGSNMPAKIITPLIILCVCLFAKSEQAVTEFSTRWFGYVLFALAVSLPIVLLVVFAVNKRKFGGLYASLDCEYIPYEKDSPSVPYSIADDVLCQNKRDETEKFSPLANGTLSQKDKE